jgi:hypothetical protein
MHNISEAFDEAAETPLAEQSQATDMDSTDGAVLHDAYQSIDDADPVYTTGSNIEPSKAETYISLFAGYLLNSAVTEKLNT